MASDPSLVRRSAVKSIAELLLDESPESFIALTLEGRIQSWNRGAQEMFGYAADEAAGCDAYMSKPIDIDALPRAVAEHLSRRARPGTQP